MAHHIESLSTSSHGLEQGSASKFGIGPKKNSPLDGGPEQRIIKKNLLIKKYNYNCLTDCYSVFCNW